MPERTFEAVEDLPNWSDFAPRFAAVYDVFGNAKTALKYSLNRYNSARTTGIAGNYNPLLEQTASLTWQDVNGDDIAQGERGCVGYPSVGCEINFNALSSNFGIRALNEYGEYPRTYNVEHGLELQHELFPRLSVYRQLVPRQLLQPDDHHQPELGGHWRSDRQPQLPALHRLQPDDGRADHHLRRGRRAAQTAPTRNLDTFDEKNQRIYNAYSLEFRARPGAGAQLFGGVSFERQQDVTCTAPDNPNTLRFCDDRRDDDCRCSASSSWPARYPLPYGISLSGSFQSVQGSTSSENMAITRNSTRYPASCPAPCPAGAIILPAAFQPATFTLQLQDQDRVYTERINQLDIKVQKTFRAGRVQVTPVFEMFNSLNSDAVVSYVSTNVLNAAYLRAEQHPAGPDARPRRDRALVTTAPAVDPDVRRLPSPRCHPGAVCAWPPPGFSRSSGGGRFDRLAPAGLSSVQSVNDAERPKPARPNRILNRRTFRIGTQLRW